MENLILSLLAPIGLTLFRAGQSQSKNLVKSLTKPFFHLSIGIVGFWLLGSGFCGDGDNAFIGTRNFLCMEKLDSSTLYYVIGGFYCCSIASLGGQEFVRLENEAVLGFAIMTFIYSIPVHWIWNKNGWLRFTEFEHQNDKEEALKTRDFAGAGLVHLIGGCAAMTLALLSKPRPGLFPTLGLRNTKWSKKSSNFGLSSITDLHKFHTNLKSGSNMALSAVGIFLSLIGSLSFIHICFYEDKIDQTRWKSETGNKLHYAIIFRCLLTISGGIWTSSLISRLLTKQWSLYRVLGGALVALVAISSCANHVTYWAAFLIGCLAGTGYIATRNIVLRFKIDDPIEAISVHAFGGMLSLFLSPILSEKYGMIYLATADRSLQYSSVLYFAWNLLTILVLICWSIVTTLIFFGPLAYFDLLGKIPDSNDETVEMREIVATNETFKKGRKSDILREKRQGEKDLRTPRLVSERPTRPRTDTFLTLPKKPTPAYSLNQSPKDGSFLNLTQEMLSKTMPLPQTQQVTVSATSPPLSPRFMTIDRHNRSRSVVNLNQNVQDLEGEDDVFVTSTLNNVFDREQPSGLISPKSEVVPIRTTPSRKIGVINSRADEENIVSPLSFKSIPRPPIIRLDDNNNSSLGSEDPQSPRGEAITRRVILEKAMALKQHDGLQRASWSNRRPLTPIDSPNNVENF